MSRSREDARANIYTGPKQVILSRFSAVVCPCRPLHHSFTSRSLWPSSRLSVSSPSSVALPWLCLATALATVCEYRSSAAGSL